MRLQSFYSKFKRKEPLERVMEYWEIRRVWYILIVNIFTVQVGNYILISEQHRLRKPSFEDVLFLILLMWSLNFSLV